METKKVKRSNLGNNPIHSLRKLSREEFIEKHGSGTLRKNHRLGFNVDYQYYHERVAYEIGYEFNIYSVDNKNENIQGYVYSPELSFDVKSRPDDPVSTEVGWIVERHLTRNMFPEDKYKLAQLDGNIVLILTETSMDIPEGVIILAKVAAYDNKFDLQPVNIS